MGDKLVNAFKKDTKERSAKEKENIRKFIKKIPFESLTGGHNIDDRGISMLCDDITYKFYAAGSKIIRQGE